MDPHIVICMNDMIISMEYKYYKEYECGSFKMNSSVAPFSLFISFFSFFDFLFFVASLALSIYLSFFLFWDILFVLFGIFFLTLHHTLQEVLNIKKTENY